VENVSDIETREKETMKNGKAKSSSINHTICGEKKFCFEPEKELN